MKIKTFLYKKKIIILTIMTLIISCKDNKQTLLGLFESQKSLHHKKIRIKNNGYLSRTGGVCKDGNFLYVFDDNGETYISIFDLNKHQFVKQFVKYGNGPNEMFYPPQSLTVLPGNILSYFDPQMRTLYQANYIQPDSIKIVKKNNLLNNANHFTKLIPMAYSYCVGIGIMDKGMYVVLDKNGNNLSYNFNYPKDETKQATNGQKFMAYQGGLIPNSDGTKFFFYCYNSEILEIMQLKKNGTLSKIKDIHFRKAEYVVQGDLNIISAAIKETSIVSFISAAATGKYIYLLYSGRAKNSDKLSPYDSNTILVFDWKGNSIVKYNLDVDIRYITVSEDDKTVYAIANTVSDTELIKFDL